MSCKVNLVSDAAICVQGPKSELLSPFLLSSFLILFFRFSALFSIISNMHVLSHLLLLSGSLMASSMAQQQQQQQQQPLSSRAQELDLKQTWYAPMEDTTDVVGFLANNWGVNNNNFYGNSDVSFESDPITNNASETVMSVLYAAGSYSPSGKHAKDGSMGGAEFNAAPFGGASYDSALLSYDLAFAENFNWVLGGKLPGIYGGM